MSQDAGHRRRPRGIDTRAVHGSGTGGGERWAGMPVNLPLVQSSTYAFGSPEEMVDVLAGDRPGYIYSRYDNPTVRAVEEKIASLEGGERALLFSSGLAAVHAALWTAGGRGGALVAGRDLYGGTLAQISFLLPRIGVNVMKVDLDESSRLEAALAAGACGLYFETPTNPLLRIFDGQILADCARRAGVPVIVDNTFATPILQNPLGWGVDLVLHSATKYLGGHSDLTLGVAVGGGKIISALEEARRTLGASPDPFAAWLLNRGLATLPIRVRRQSDTAARLAHAIQKHPAVARVNYPGLEDHPGHTVASRQMRGFGGMISFDLHGGLSDAMEFLRGLNCFMIATSLGGVESLVSHPVTSSHRMVHPDERKATGIGDGLVRLSVGLEDPDDLREDLLHALDGVGTSRR